MPKERMSGSPVAVHEVATDESVSEAVVSAVAAVSGATPVPDPTSADTLEPLYDVVDPDALDALFDATSRDDVQVSFGYHDSTVTVRSDGLVTVE